MRNILFLIAALQLIFFSSLKAQSKFEKEKKIKKKDVPIQALDFIDSLSKDASVLWYYEKGLDTESLEAKLRINRINYSIEFSIEGDIQDIEIETKLKQIPQGGQTKITTSLDSLFKRYKLIKIQEQYSGETTELLTIIRDRNNYVMVTPKWELVVEGNIKGRVKLYELSYTSDYVLENIKEIITGNTHNLE